MPNEQIKERNINRALHSAYGLFLENGIERTTVEMLVRATDISRSSLDRYFNNKLDLVLQTAAWAAKHIRDERVPQHIFSHESSLTGLAALKRYMQLMLELLYQDPRLFLLAMELRAYVFRNSSQDPGAANTLKHCLGFSPLLEEIMERGMQDGSIRPGLHARTEAIMTREATLCFFSSIALANDPSLLHEHKLADLFVRRIIDQYQNE